MNLALPLLLIATAAGLLWRRPELRLAWIVCCLTGILVSLPALLRPTGLLSPAATLASVAPWQTIADPDDGNATMGDVTFQIQPWQFFARSETRSGRLPFWNPHQAAGTPFWANGQSAPLFPLNLLFATLPLALGFVILPWLRIVIATSGTWALARELGLGRPGAALAAITFSLSGMLVSFLLYPMGNALALVPWVLLAVERIAAGRGTWRSLALLAGLQLLAGHPETCLHTALVSTLYVAVRGGLRQLSVVRTLLLGWLAAGALAAVQILPFALAVRQSSRWQSWHLLASDDTDLGLLLTQPLRLLFPELYGSPVDGTWWGPFNYLATSVYVGVLALPLAAAGFGRLRGDRRWLALAVVLAASFAGAYHLPGMRQFLEVLPLIGRALHHRLIFVIELVLALAAGAGLERWLAGQSRRTLLWGCATVALGGVAVAGAMYGAWAEHGIGRSQLLWTGWILLASSLLATSLALVPTQRRRLGTLLIAVMALDLVIVHGSLNPAIDLEQLYPETGAVRFLLGRQERVAGLGYTLRPNAATVYGLFDVRVDDTVKLERYERVNEALGGAHPTFFRPLRNWDSPWLDRLGVRWIIGGPRDRPPRDDWIEVYRGNDAIVWERPNAFPQVRWATAAEGQELDISERRAGLWRLSWRTPVPSRIVVAEIWAPGWRARLNGVAVPLELEQDALLAVEVEPGEGELDLRYRPPGLIPGAILGLAVLAALVCLTLHRRRGESLAGVKSA